VKKPKLQAVTLTICEGIMDTSIERIRAKITELEARLADLRIAERELLALETAPAPNSKRRPKAKGAAGARQTVGAAIAEVLTQHGAIPAAEIAGHIKAAGQEIGSRTISFTLQAMKKRGLVKIGGGKWKLAKPRSMAARR
jgi:hypothetical protein